MSRSTRPRFAPQDIDADGAERALARARDLGISLDDPAVAELIARAGASAPTVLPALFARPDLAPRLVAEIAARGAIAPAFIAAPTPHEVHGVEALDATKRQLRHWRHEALARTALRELYAHADVDRTAREWSHVAAACTEHAVAIAGTFVEQRNGSPIDEARNRVPFVVLGMGKLGGDELNLGSDIDVCFFYGTDDGAAGERTLNEHFGRVGALASELLDEVTGDGFVFRVDLRLRPEGSRGPMANSLGSAERYYETWGRSWERAALVRARPIAGDRAFGDQLLEALRPFVYRRAVDPRIAADLSQMLTRTRREQLRDGPRDLKIGPGGIREAEFFVQALQLVWGGRHRSLQVANTLDAVRRLRALGLLSDREARNFGDAWALLRRTEHAVQIRAAYATHLLPDSPMEQRALARALGYASFDEFAVALGHARDVISRLFASLFPHQEGTERPPSAPPQSLESVLADLVAQGAPAEAVAAQAREALGVRDAENAVDELHRLARRADMPLGVVGRDRHPALAPRLLAEVRDAPDPDLALGHLADLFSRLRGVERYAERLANSPELARGLVGLFGASETLSKTLLARPELIDAVISGAAGAPGVDEIATLVETSIALARRDVGPDEDPIEVSVAAMRRVLRETTLQIGLADIAGVLTAGEVARRLSALAGAVLTASFVLAGEDTAERFGTRDEAATPLDGVAVIALGSLAARELGYGGDVDLIVLYDRDGETRGGRRAGITTAEYVARLTQRAMSLLSMPHPAGPGYAVDTRLRPSGSQGTLVVSFDAFARYHATRTGAPGAASWERQALIRSRFACGDPIAGHQAEQIIARAAYEQGVDGAEILRLRERMERELGRETASEISLKYGRGGLVDVEFAAQALQMAHGHDRSIRTPTTRHALVRLRDAGVLDATHADALLSGEKLLRRTLLATRLVTERSSLCHGTASASTVARKLGYRQRAQRTAEEALFEDLASTRERVRDAFRAAVEALTRSDAI